MKKILSMILCVVMVLSLAAVTFAAEDNTPVLGDNTITIPVNPMANLNLVFTAEEAGTYVITNTDENGGWLRDDTYSWYDQGETFEETLEAGGTISFQIYNALATDADTAVSFNITKVDGGEDGGDEEEKVVNDEPQVGENYMLVPQGSLAGKLEVVFVAPEDGTYVFIPASDYNSYLLVAGTWGDEYVFGSHEVELVAGEEFTFKIQAYNAYGNYDDYVSFTIEKKAEGGEGDEGGETNDVPVLGDNEIAVPSGESYHTVTFTAEEAGTYKFVNTHPAADYQGFCLNNGSWLWAGDSQTLELAAGEDVSIKLYSPFSDPVKFSIVLNPEEGGDEGGEDQGETNETPVLGDNNIPVVDSYYRDVEFVVEESGIYKFTNNHEAGDVRELYVYGGLGYIEAGESGMMRAEAGDVIEITLYSDDKVPVNFTIEKIDESTYAPDGSELFPFELPMGELNVSMDADQELFYVFTATEDGVLSLTGELDGGYIDCDGMIQNAEGAYVKNVRAGEEVTVELSSSWYNPAEMLLQVAFEAGELQPNGSEEYPFELNLGEMEVSFNGSSACYIFTATEDGYLVIETGLSGNDLSNAMFYCDTNSVSKKSDGTASVYAYAGDVLVIEMGSYGTLNTTYNVSFNPGEMVGDGSSDAPFTLPVGEWDVFISSSDAYSGYYYSFKAAEDGVLNIAFNNDMADVYVYAVKLNGESITISLDNFSLEMAEGDKLFFNLWANNEIDFTTTVTFETEGDEPVDPPVDPEDPEDPVDPPVDPEDPIDPTGDNTLVFFALVVLSMTGLVVLVSKKRAF